MQRVERIPLPPGTAAHLADATRSLAARPVDEQRAEARRRWQRFRGKHRVAVRDTLRAMASGLERCMYCEDGFGTDIDHWEPKSRAPARTFDWDNHLLACAHCNSNQKRDRFPTDGDGALLLDPCRDDPWDHLTLSLTTGEFSGSGRKGDPSIVVFGLNRHVCTKGRLNAVLSVQALTAYYVRLKPTRPDVAAQILRTLREAQFQGVRSWIARLVATRAAATLIDPDLVAAVQAHPELLE